MLFALVVPLGGVSPPTYNYVFVLCTEENYCIWLQFENNCLIFRPLFLITSLLCQLILNSHLINTIFLSALFICKCVCTNNKRIQQEQKSDRKFWHFYTWLLASERPETHPTSTHCTHITHFPHFSHTTHIFSPTRWVFNGAWRGFVLVKSRAHTQVVRSLSTSSVVLYEFVSGKWVYLG